MFPVLRRWDLPNQLTRALKDSEAIERSIANQKGLYSSLYHHPDGLAGKRAAEAIAELL